MGITGNANPVLILAIQHEKKSNSILPPPSPQQKKGFAQLPAAPLPTPMCPICSNYTHTPRAQCNANADAKQTKDQEEGEEEEK